MAFGHLRKIASEVTAAVFFALLSDEVTNCANREKVIVCLRWVDSKLMVHEGFIGLHHVADITTDTVVQVLQDTVIRINLKLVTYN